MKRHITIFLMSTQSIPPADHDGIEIVSTRIFDAPRAAVFGAFEDPALLARWWGPNGFTDTIQQFDFRPGGRWRHVMHGPDGKDYANTSEFVEVTKPERVMFDHLEPVHRFRMIMTYEALAATRTRLTWRMVFPRSEQNEQLRTFLADANQQNFDRLAAVLVRHKA